GAGVVLERRRPHRDAVGERVPCPSPPDGGRAAVPARAVRVRGRPVKRSRGGHRMATQIVEGRPAPDFTLEDARGTRVSLSDFRGRDVVVYFYPKDDTPGCTKEACGFRDHWKDLQKAGVVVLGISADSAASHAKFATKYKLPFPLLSDPDRKVMEAWGAYGDKLMYGKK